MFDTSYDEKSAYEQRYASSKHSKHNSYDSNNSYTSYDRSQASSSDKYNEDNPPAYTHLFYNTLEDKPLPPLPGCEGRRVRFMVEKPLPPLPSEEKQRSRSRSSSSSRMGECAWWTRDMEDGTREYDVSAARKEMS